jgi:hypothetical protein
MIIIINVIFATLRTTFLTMHWNIITVLSDPMLSYAKKKNGENWMNETANFSSCLTNTNNFCVYTYHCLFPRHRAW